MRKQVVAAAQVSTGSSSVGSCSLVWGVAHLGGLFCLLAGAWDWSHTGPLADWSLQHLGGCAGDKNSVGPSSAGHSELRRSVLSRSGVRGRERGASRKRRTGLPLQRRASRWPSSFWAVPSPHAADCAVCQDAPADELDHSSSWAPDEARGLVCLSGT